MAPPREIELKLQVPANQMARLRALPLLRRAASAKPKTLVSVYFDTGKRKLRKSGLSLRVRHTDGHYTQTIKQRGGKSAGLFARNEWEKEIDGDKPDLDAADGTALDRLLDKKLRRRLKPVFKTRVRRQVLPIRKNGSEIALTIDQGKVEAAGRSSPLRELELESKDGEAHALFAVARTLGNAAALQLASKSKSGHGYALLDEDEPRPVKAEPIALPPDADWATAFKRIAHACLYQLVANLEALRRQDLEAVHQMRIALRRLRTAISLFSNILDGPQTEAMKSQFKWLTTELGPAREFDVFVKRVVRRVERPGGRGVGTRAVAEDFRAKRAKAMAEVEKVIASPRFRRLMLDTVAWIEAGDWASNDAYSNRMARQRAVAVGAADELQRRAKKVCKQGARLAGLDRRQRHKLRVKAKKLRYACEFFAGAFAGKKRSRRREKFVGKLKKLQSALGDLNDIVVHKELATRSVAARNGPARRRHRARKAFAAGRLAGQEEARFASAMKVAERAYGDFAETERFWH